MKETKQERKERGRARDKAKMPQHGGSLTRIYRDAILKRAKVVGVQKQPTA